jgi:hypothetical protein
MDDRADLSLAARFTQGLGLVDTSMARVHAALKTYRLGGPGEWRLISDTSDLHESLRFLSTLTFPATRHVLVATCRGGTAFVNNCRDGSDYADYTYSLPRHLNCRFARVVSRQARFWTDGVNRERLQYEARIFALFDLNGQVIRTVACLDDGGRWRFETSGEPHPVEAEFPYSARRKSDRFSDKNLRDLADEIGLSVPDAGDFVNAGHYLLYEETRGFPVESCTIEEADDPAYGYYMRGMGYVKHMDSHATSVIHDLEKCVALNAAYEPRVRHYLDDARRRAAGFSG